MDTLPPSLIHLAERQHGLVTREQALRSGLSRAAWRHACRRGDWDRLSTRVARRPGSPRTVQQRVLAGVLDVGPSAYVSHLSGAALWGVPNLDIEPVELIVPRGGRQTATTLARIHRPRHLPDPFGTVLDGIPVVRPALVLLQLAPRLSPARLKWMLDRMWNLRLVSGASMRRELEPLLHRGRAGTVAIRELLDSLPADYVPPASGLESRFEGIVSRGGIVMRRQVDLGDDEAWSGRVDFLDAQVPLIVEVDSERYHSALTDRAADERRADRLRAAGFTVLRVRDTDVWRHPDEVLARVRRARQLLIARRAA